MTGTNSAYVHGSTNGTNGTPILFKVLPMVPLVIPLVQMVMQMVPLASQWYGKPMVPLATNGTIGKITNGTIGKTPKRASASVKLQKNVNFHQDTRCIARCSSIQFRFRTGVRVLDFTTISEDEAQ